MGVGGRSCKAKVWIDAGDILALLDTGASGNVINFDFLETLTRSKYKDALEKVYSVPKVKCSHCY